MATILKNIDNLILGSKGIVVRVSNLYWSGWRFESLSTCHCWALNKSFVPSLEVVVMSPKAHLAVKRSKKKWGGLTIVTFDKSGMLQPLVDLWKYSTIVRYGEIGFVRTVDTLEWRAELLLRRLPCGIREMKWNGSKIQFRGVNIEITPTLVLRLGCLSSVSLTIFLVQLLLDYLSIPF